MALPIKYNLSNVLVRWRTTLATVLGVMLVVAVYVMLQAMAAGLERSSRNTGDPRNLMIVRKGSTAESSSQVTLEQFRLLQHLPQIARDAQDRPLVSADVMVLINLPRRDQAGEANVVVRGVSPLGLELRPQIRPTAGRWFEPGKREVVVSASMAKRFANFEIGGTFRTAGKELTVVGHFDGGYSAFDSEVWMDGDEARSVFDRENYSSLLLRLKEGVALQHLGQTNLNPLAETVRRQVESDKRLPLRVDAETEYYGKQTMTAQPIKWMGNFLAAIMSVGAAFAAMNTMYASIGARTREIGTLRVLGFKRRAILLAILTEGAFLSLIGGALGVAAAYGLQVGLQTSGVTFGTFNFESFSEVIFQFRITPAIVTQGLAFSVIVGMLGSLLPAIRAARLPVIAALKAV
jgi:putative ABC transport system permease protein